MALHTELKIYRDASDLLRVVTAAVVQMPKGAKPVIGARILSDAMGTMAQVRHANAVMGTKRAEHLGVLIDLVADVNELAKSCWDQRLITNGRYGLMIQLTVEIGKQATGWRNKALQPVSPGARLR